MKDLLGDEDSFSIKNRGLAALFCIVTAIYNKDRSHNKTLSITIECLYLEQHALTKLGVAATPNRRYSLILMGSLTIVCNRNNVQMSHHHILVVNIHMYIIIYFIMHLDLFSFYTMFGWFSAETTDATSKLNFILSIVRSSTIFSFIISLAEYHERTGRLGFKEKG
ncbi:hypothetical protein ACJX0J_031188 [Zea mays]